MKCLNTEKFSKVAQNIGTGRLGITKRSLLNKLYKEITPITQGFFHDNSWEPITKIRNKFDEILGQFGGTFTMMDNYYDREHSPPHYKVWKFQITFTNQKGRPDTIYGQIIASGAGNMNDILGRYDLTVTMG